MVGSSLGHYDVTGRLGQGGMGEVYEATDSKLGRRVAIKILPEAFASDADRVARFEREARLLASLNHPHIAVIHGLEESNGRAFLVMELVEGSTLGDLIATHPSGLPVADVLTIAGQIGDGLSAAHERGVIHRDLKPSNIKVMSDGRVKLLDFGLAKAIEEANGSGGAGTAGGVAAISQSPTLTSPAMTQAGLILGTAAYMSPEQAKGAVVDRRTDIFSFGCVLYEMLTGKQAFEEGTVAGTLARVIEREPDWTILSAQTPSSLRRLLRRCLVKDRSHRLQHIGDARLEIEEARSEPGTASPSPVGAGTQSRERAAWIVAGVLAVALAGAVAVPSLRTGTPPSEIRVDMNVPASLDPFSMAVSPDGRMLAFVAAPDGQQRLWLRRLDQSTATPMQGTEGAFYPFWSPDSRSIAFFAGSDLKRINLDDRVARTLTRTIPGNGGSWGPDGQILFAPTPGSGLFRVPASGGEPIAVTRAEGTEGFGHRFPQLLPDGRRFLFYIFGAPAERGIYVASFDNPGDARRITTADGAGLYVEPGWLLFAQQGTLLARRFDRTSAELSGDPVVIAEGVSTNGASARAFSASSNGILAYAASATKSRLTWFDRSGTPMGTVGTDDDVDLLDPEISPDGSRVAVARESRNNADIWIYDDTAGTRITLDAANERFPLWSPDGSQLLFQSDRKGTLDLYLASSANPGRERVLTESPERKFPGDWSPDGLSALYFQVRQRDAQSAGIDLWLRSFGAGESERAWLTGDATELWPQFSPTGEFVAYYSTESGTSQEVYVRRFASPDDRWTISTGGGVYARWARNGREIYYIDPEGRLMAAPIAIKGTELVAGTPKELFRPRIVGGGLNRVGHRHQFDVHPDGRFLVNVEPGGGTSSISLLLHWNPER